MKKRIILVTGLAGWLGGLGTMVLAGSCDTECEPNDNPSVYLDLVPAKTDYDPYMNARDVTVRYRITGDGDIREGIDAEPRWETGRCIGDYCMTWGLGFDEAGHYEIEVEVCGHVFEASADVELDDEGCHALPVSIDVPIAGQICGTPEMEPPDRTPTTPPGEEPCMDTNMPSIWVTPVRRYDDYFTTVDVERVYFRPEGDREKQSATCVEGSDGTCQGWIAGFGVTGEITVSTEYCNTVVEEKVWVPADANGCGLQTQHLQLEVSTIGCMTDEFENNEPPPPAKMKYG